MAEQQGEAAKAPVVSENVFTVPNLISIARLLLVPVFAWAIFTRHDGIAILVLVVSGFSDYLDGYLARRLNQISKLGQALDPAADRLFILSTLLGLGYRHIVPWWVVALIVARDVIMVAGTVPLARRVGASHLPVHFLGKAATFNLLYAFPLILLGDASEGPTFVALILGWAFAWWGIGLYWWSGYLYVKQALSVRREVALPPRRVPTVPPGSGSQ